MTIASEIARLQAAKVDIMAALVEKGVDVTGKNLVDVPDLIDSIETEYQNFVLMDNGVKKIGIEATSGSLGPVYYEESGWVESSSSPYYLRSTFTGSNYVVYQDSKLADTFINSHTLEMWFKVTSYPNSQFLVQVNNNSGQTLHSIYFNSSYGVTTLNLNSINKHPSSYFLFNQWNHIALEYNSNDKELIYFVNGKLEGTRKLSLVNTYDTLRFRFSSNESGVRVAQIAVREGLVWTSEFNPPRNLYK